MLSLACPSWSNRLVRIKRDQTSLWGSANNGGWAAADYDGLKWIGHNSNERVEMKAVVF